MLLHSNPWGLGTRSIFFSPGFPHMPPLTAAALQKSNPHIRIAPAIAMAPTPRSAASMFCDASIASKLVNPLSHAAYNGDLHSFKKLVRLLELDEGKGSLREAVEASRADRGMWPLQHAALGGRLEVCRYLLEELRVDVDVPGDDGTTALIYAIVNGKTDVVKYLLDHGANPDKADNCGVAPLHHAAGIGNCEMVESLLAKGAHVDPLAVCGTPLRIAAKEGQAGTMKNLLEHNADVNKTEMVFGVTPLFVAIEFTSVKCVKLLVEAGADVKADCILAALNDDTKNVSSECLNLLQEAGANRDVPDNEEGMNKRKVAHLKSLGSKAVERKDYLSASGFYSKAMVLDPDDATLFSKRSLCWLCMDDGQKALMDALECRNCVLTGQRLATGRDYKSACDALFDGFKIDPDNAEIEHALREAMESLKISQSTKPS